MTEAGLGFQLTIMGGQAVAGLAGRPVGTAGRLDLLELEIPNLRFPFDLSGGAEEFRDRRCNLHGLTFSAGGADLRGIVAAAELGRFGIEGLDIAIRGTVLRLSGHVRVGGREADVTALGAFRRAGENRVRLALFDLRVYGFLPVPAPLLATAMFSGLGAQGGPHRPVSGEAGVRLSLTGPKETLLQIVGPTDLELNVLDLILFSTLPQHGWRMPDRRGVRLRPVENQNDRLVLCFETVAAESEESGPFGALETGVGAPELWAHEEGRVAYASAESALLSGEASTALEIFRRAATLSAGSGFVNTRLLQLLVASPSTWAEADEIAGAVLARHPDSTVALMARATMAVERGRPAVAAQTWDLLAEQALRGAAPADEAAALTAAARALVSMGDENAAVLRLERALRVRPGHGAAARLLAERLRATGRWDDLLALLRQRSADESDDKARALLLAEAGHLMLAHQDDIARARARFEQALRLDPGASLAWEGLGRVGLRMAIPEDATRALENAAAGYARASDPLGVARVEVALSELDQAAFRNDEALSRLRRAADLSPLDGAPLRAAGDLAMRMGRGGDAVSAFEGALGRAQHAVDRVLILRRLAAVRREIFGDMVEARTLLERALRESPSDAGLLDDLGGVLIAAGDGEELEAYLRRAFVEATTPEARRAVLGRMVELGRLLNAGRLEWEALAALVSEGGPEIARVALEFVSTAERAGESAHWRDTIARVEPVLLASADLNPMARSELAFRLAGLAERLQDDDATLGFLRMAIEGEVEPEVLGAAWKMFAEVALRRGDVAAAAQTLLAWADDHRTLESDRVRAGHHAAAATLFREHLDAPFDAEAALERAFALHADDDQICEALVDALEARGDLPRAVAILSRRLAGPGASRSWFRKLGSLLARLGRAAEAADTWRSLLERDPSDREALREMARLSWGEGDKSESARHYAALIDIGDGGAEDRDEGVLAEAHLRLGQWARVVGRAAEANQHLDTGLLGEPRGAPVEVVVEVLEAFGRTHDLMAILQSRLEAAAPPGDRLALSRILGGVLERNGQTAEAILIYRRLLSDDPDDVESLRRLAEIFRRESRTAELLDPIDRLFALACNHETDSVEVLGIELASLLTRTPGAGDRAESVLRKVLARHPSSSEALQALSELLLDRGAIEESDEALAQRVNLEGGAADALVALVERARARAINPRGDLGALALLRRLPIDALPVDGLLLRAQLAEKIGDAGDALAALSSAWEDMTVAADGSEKNEVDVSLKAEITERLIGLCGRPMSDLGVGIAALERMASFATADAALLAALFRLYERLPDLRGRNRAWASLLGRKHLLQHKDRGRIHAALGQAAETDGDLARSESEFRAALALDSDAATRADHLVGHARALLGLKDIENAEADLEEALVLVPTHAGALFQLGELSYRNQEWERARAAFLRLAMAPGRHDVVSPELLAFRGAELAETFGDEAEAESAYAEVARLDPRHIEAREALLQIALYRQDRPEAARRLEELLQMFPAEAIDKIRDARVELGRIRLALDDGGAARHHLELVVAEDPEHIEALMSLVTVYQNDKQHGQTAVTLARLGRLLPEPRARAEALFQQAEILRIHLGEDAAAGDAYLRSADTDPTFTPTLSRLVHHYFVDADWFNLVEVGAELDRLHALGDPECARCFLGALLLGQPGLARPLWIRARPGIVGALADLGARGKESDGAQEIARRLLSTLLGFVAVESGPDVGRDLEAEIRRVANEGDEPERAGAAAILAAWPSPL